MNETRITITLPHELYLVLRQAAFDEQRSQRSLIEEALYHYFELKKDTDGPK